MGSGMPAVIGTPGAVLCPAAIVMAAAIIGDRILTWMRLPRQGRLEWLCFSTGLGLGILSYIAFALGTLSLLSATSIRAVWLIWLALAVALWRRARRSVLQNKTGVVSPTPLPKWTLALLLGAALYLICVYITCIGPVLDYDGLAYHIAAPKHWLELGGMRFLPTHLPTYWPLGFEMLFMMQLPVAGILGCKPLVAIAAALTAGVVYAMGTRCANRTVGIAAAACFLLGAGADKINTTSIEMAQTLFVALSALALAGWRHSALSGHNNRWLVLAAIMAGLANCIKLNSVLPMGLLAIAIFIMPAPTQVRPIVRLRAAALFIGMALLIAAPWYLRTWYDTGNPIYPFAYRLLGGRDWSEQASAVMTTYYHYFNLPGDSLAARRAVLLHLLIKLGVVTLIGVLLPGPRWMRGMALAAGAFAMIQVALSDQMRYLLPGLPFAVIVFSWWMVHLASRRPLLGWIASVAVVALALPSVLKDALTNLPIAMGTVSRETIVRSNISNYAACLWANRSLPVDAHVLFGPDTRSYFLQRDAYWSHQVLQHLIVYDTPAAFTASLRRAGITYFIFNRGTFNVPELQFEVKVGWRAGERRYLEKLAARSIPLYTANSVTVYRLPADLSSMETDDDQ